MLPNVAWIWLIGLILSYLCFVSNTYLLPVVGLVLLVRICSDLAVCIKRMSFFTAKEGLVRMLYLNYVIPAVGELQEVNVLPTSEKVINYLSNKWDSLFNYLEKTFR